MREEKRWRGGERRRELTYTHALGIIPLSVRFSIRLPSGPIIE
jgi:hypothetical protein